MSKKETDKISGVETTGHEWDGIKELNNPAPRLWLIVFFITVIWAIGYWVVYPAWPTLSGHTKGKYGWTQYKQLSDSQAEIRARKSLYLDKFEKSSLEQIGHNPDLYNFAVAGGKTLFKDNCATCHGTGGAGGNGYPNLNDDDWLYGGRLIDIYQVVKYGIRSTHDETKFTAMPAFRKDGILTDEEIELVADHVINIKTASRKTRGAKIYKEQCASCHKANGTGDIALGAPNLADAIWLYGGDKDTVIETISNSRAGVMPHWVERLSDEQIKQLTIYVHSLGGGK